MPIHAAFSRAATRLTEWTQRWVPGTFTIAWLLTLIVLVLGMTVGRASFIRCIEAWGDGFWELLPFSMQMALIMFTGAIVAVSPPVRRALAWLASRPRTPRQSVLLVALSSMLLALLHWGISVVGSAVLVREMGRRRSGADYRLMVAAAYLGMGTTWLAAYVAREQHPVTLNALNFVMMGLAIALHPSPASLVAAAEEASGLLHGIILQFPLYAGMYGIIRETHLAEALAGLFVAGASARPYPAIV